MTNDDIIAKTTAAFLNSFSKTINQWSMVFVLAALILLGLKQLNYFLIASVIFGLLQAYFAARCSFDRLIFQTLLGDLKHYQVFDTILNDWKLSKNTTERPLNQRIYGALKLLKQQGISFMVQVLLLSLSFF